MGMERLIGKSFWASVYSDAEVCVVSLVGFEGESVGV